MTDPLASIDGDAIGFTPGESGSSPERGSSLWLIAHKVRGERAFDIAQQLEVGDQIWWIIPTSGHRAYPYWYAELDGLGRHSDYGFNPDMIPEVPPCELRDHYITSEPVPPASPKPSVPRLEDI